MKLFWGWTAYLTIVKISQAGPLNYSDVKQLFYIYLTIQHKLTFWCREGSKKNYKMQAEWQGN